eukprot:gene7976-8730_t
MRRHYMRTWCAVDAAVVFPLHLAVLRGTGAPHALSLPAALHVARVHVLAFTKAFDYGAGGRRQAVHACVFLLWT